MTMKNELILGDCVPIMQSLDNEIIDLTVTSPPYDDLRSYDGYLFRMEETVKELYRITKKGGVVVWVVGDSVVDKSETLTSFKQALTFKEIGFNVHDTMIYQKNSSSLPDPTRYNQSFEYMFIFSKESPKTVNKIRDHKNTYFGLQSTNTVREKDGKLYPRRDRVAPEYSERGNIWSFDVGYNKSTTDNFAFDHPAMFPEKLAKDHILSWSNEGDLVLDPFCGSATTCKMAQQQSRNYIGIEMSEKYMEIAKRRMAQTVLQSYQ